MNWSQLASNYRRGATKGRDVKEILEAELGVVHPLIVFITRAIQSLRSGAEKIFAPRCCEMLT